MNVFFAAFHTSMSAAGLAARRRKLARLLHRRGLTLVSLKDAAGSASAVTRLVREAKGAPVIALDDAHPLPARAPWMESLTKEAEDLAGLRRPRLIYVTRQANAAGRAAVEAQTLVRRYVKRDERDLWIGYVIEAAADLADQAEAAEVPTGVAPATLSDVVGTSQCFLEAVAGVGHLLRSPYGLLTGAPGVGKILLLRALWAQLAPKARLTVLPCGSFFKDYYVQGSLRRFGGGREAVEQLDPYLRESDKGLLVLHHVEQLPTALQEELDARLSVSSGEPTSAARLAGIDSHGLAEYDVKIIATSTFSPAMLAQSHRMIPDLLAKLRKRHVQIPSLEDRGPQDKRLLCEDILARIGRREGRQSPPVMDPAVAQALCRTFWPNNISDLVRVLEHAVYRAGGGKIRMEHLPKDLAAVAPGSLQTLDDVVAQAERTAIQYALDQTGGNVTRAAERLKRNKHALYRLMASLGMTRDRTSGAGRD